MKRIGMKPPRIPGIWNLSDLLPDSTRPAMRDISQRNIYLQGQLEGAHTSLAVSDEADLATDGLPQRLRSVQVSGVSGGTVTVQVKVNGVDAFPDAVRPVSGVGTQDVPAPYIFMAGTEVTSVIEATTGAPTGTAHVAVDTEPYVLLGRFKPVELQGKDRMFPSRRRAAEVLNTNAVPAGAEQTSRLNAYTYGGTSPLTPSSSTIARGSEGGTAAGTSVRDATTPRPRLPVRPPRPGLR